MALTRVKLEELIAAGEIEVGGSPVGAIYQSTVSTSPATLFGGTWAAVGGRMLVGVDGTYTAGSTGGAATHTQTLGAGYAKIAGFNYLGAGYVSYRAKSVPDYLKNREVTIPTSINLTASGTMQEAVELGGSTDAGSSMPPYLSVYMWKRTA